MLFGVLNVRHQTCVLSCHHNWCQLYLDTRTKWVLFWIQAVAGYSYVVTEMSRHYCFHLSHCYSYLALNCVFLLVSSQWSWHGKQDEFVIKKFNTWYWPTDALKGFCHCLLDIVSVNRHQQSDTISLCLIYLHYIKICIVRNCCCHYQRFHFTWYYLNSGQYLL